MKKLILIAVFVLPMLSNAQERGLLSRGHYVPEKLQDLVIEESECEEMKDSINWQVSIPFENNNYVYEIHNSKNHAEFTEISKTRISPNYKGVGGLTAYIALYAAILILL